MVTLSSQVSSIKLKINKVLTLNRRLNEQLEKKQQQLDDARKENQLLLDRLQEREEAIVTLKTANAMLGSSEFKTKTKLKINALVKEIDQCIAQLT